MVPVSTVKAIASYKKEGSKLNYTLYLPVGALASTENIVGNSQFVKMELDKILIF